MIQPNYTTALDNKGLALFALGKDNEALGYLDKALSLDPKDADALNGKGVVLAKLGNYYEAI